MIIDITTLSADDLKFMLCKAEADLQQCLIQGLSWEDLKAKRDLVTDIAIHLYKAKYPLSSASSGTPADKALR